jgi:hypothetical protein
MTLRIAAGLLAIFATGAMLAPVETNARGGGFVGGRAMPVHGALPGPLVRPGMAPPPVAVRPARVNPLPFAHLRHRRFVETGVLSSWGDLPWGSGYGSGYYDSSSYLPPLEQPAYTYPTSSYPVADGPVRERIIYVLPPRPSCGTQTYKVPAEDGGERSINVVRC